MASPPASRIAASTAEQPLLPDEILEVIFLRLDSGYDLACASATCRAFRRVATGRRFLRHFTSLHPPPLVGFINFEAIPVFHPTDPPHRSAPAARALAQAGDYEFSFLPNDSHPVNKWILCDVRDGRFLHSRYATGLSTFLQLVVSDPLYRRYVQIPLIPGDLVPRMPSCSEMESEPFLAPAEEEVKSDQDSHFRVIYNWLSTYKLVSFVFSTATGKWCCATTFGFLPARLIFQPKKLERYYARGCFYWVHSHEKYMLVLDPCEMKFSLVLHDKNKSHRSNSSVRKLAIIDVAEDRLGLITLDGYRMLDLFTKTYQNNGVGEDEWRHEKFLRLPETYYDYLIIGAAEGYLLLRGFLCSAVVHYFVLNLESFVVERLYVSKLNGSIYQGHPYASFPPPLSLPSL